METVDLAIKYQDQGAVGVDLCGDPSKGDLYIFTPALAKAKEAGLRLTIHFAEVPASSSQAELETLLSFQPDRLGHVIYVPDSIKAEIVRRKIAIELCISCNVQAKLTEGGIQDHHFGWWKSAPNPLVLCTDDVGVFNSKLSNEYLLVARHFGLGQRELRELSQRGIDAVFGGEDEKARLRAIWKCVNEP